MSLIFGIIALPMFLFVAPALVAIITGFIARREIARSNGIIEGKPRATAGLILGLVSFLPLAALITFAALAEDDSFGRHPLLPDDPVVGACVDVPLGSPEVRDLPRQQCSEPHEGEVIAVALVPQTAGRYPGEDVVFGGAEAQCREVFENVVGEQYDESDLELFITYPNATSWVRGDRTYACIVIGDDGELLPAGTVAGRGAPPERELN